MTEKSKNDQKRKRPYRKIVGIGCLFVMLIGCLGIAIIFAEFDAWHNVYGGAIDLCMGQVSNVHPDFQLVGHVVDAQGQPIAQADVKLDGSGIRECDKRITSYSTRTNASGEFSFGPDLFEYVETFFVTASIENCTSAPVHSDKPSDEITIVLDCSTAP